MTDFFFLSLDGWKASCRQAVVGGILLAVIEGVMVIFSRTSKSTPRDQYYEALKYEESQQVRKRFFFFLCKIFRDLFPCNRILYQIHRKIRRLLIRR